MLILCEANNECLHNSEVVIGKNSIYRRIAIGLEETGEERESKIKDLQIVQLFCYLLSIYNCDCY